ncbi:MAG: hypothetical protein EHM61_03230, partial [Acidobacteria bacterium]
MRSTNALIRFGLFACLTGSLAAQNLFDLPGPGVQTRWITFENQKGEKGQGGIANQGRKGSAATSIKAGQTFTM